MNATLIPHLIQILVWCGERSDRIAALLGIHPKTVKRSYQRAATAVRIGRPSASPAGWFRRGRLGKKHHRVRQFLECWITEGLDQVLAGEGPYFQMELAATFGLRTPEQVAGICRRIRIGPEQPAARLVCVQPRRCVVCGHPYLAFAQWVRPALEQVTCPRAHCRKQLYGKSIPVEDLRYDRTGE